ncbi:MAG: AraC family transcriptional regulator [Thermomicrobiales bacterium]|nr:AraC family transcriptional regulator [Thermomicrobiales bacterium]
MPIEELRGLIAAHAGRRATPIAGLQVASVDAPTAPRSSIASPILAVVAQGSKRIVFGERVYEYGAGDYLVVSVDLPITGQFVEASRERPFLGVGLDLRPDLIASLLMQTADERSRPTARSAPPLAASRAPAELLDAIVRLVRLLDHPADAPVLAPLIEREIVWRLMTGSQGAVVRQLGLTDSSFSRVGRAIRWIRDHPAEAFRVEELAMQASMSLSSFHRHFRAVTAMSPVQFQKKVRLQQARLLLIGDGLDVAGAAFSVGYDSPSQFIREYRREFGAPPGRDATRLRLEAGRMSFAALP